MELFAAVAIAAAIGAIVRFGANARRPRAARVAIADAPEGRRARVVGKILDGGDGFEAPASGRRCVYYAFTIERYVGSGYQSWQTLFSEARGTPFAITDGTGRALIDPDGAEVEIDRAGSLTRGAVDDRSPRAQAVLARLRLERPGGLFASSFRYREAALIIGETIAVTGVAVREPDPDAIAAVSGYREGPPTRLRLGGSRAQPLLISDAADAIG